MVKNGHISTGAIPGFGFSAPGSAGMGLAVMDLAELRRRVPDDRLQLVHRVDFHTITLVTQGSGEHTVDFMTHSCRPGTVLWVRPGQVQRFDQAARMNGPHLLFTAAFPPAFNGAGRLVAAWAGPACWQLGTGGEYAAVAGLLAQLRAEQDRPPAAVSREILQFLLATLMLHIDRLPCPWERDPRHEGGEVYARFQAELEHSYLTTRRAEDYAACLRYGVKTLTRACLAATGHPVKHVIDARVVLQAQRLLAQTDDPVATIARRLGFTEPSNFGKFFARHTGSTPGDFRRASRDEA